MAGMQYGKAELAQCLGVSLPTVGQWIRKGCPYVEKGGVGKKWLFDSAEVIAWREEQVTLQALGDTQSLDIEEARRRKLAAEATMAELELAKRRGEVIEIDQVASVIGDDYANVRAKLLALSTKLAPQLVGVESLGECQQLIERGVTEALEELTADEVYASESSPEETRGRETSESEAAA